MHQPSTTLMLSILLLAGSAEAEIAAGRYAKVFKGKDGVTVTMTLVQPYSEQTALIKVLGIEHPLDGLVLLYRNTKVGRDDESYSTIIQGRRWSVLRSRQDSSGQRHHLDLGEGGKTDLVYNEAESKKVKPATLLDEYRKLVKSGAVAKVQGIKLDERKQLTRVEVRDRARGHKNECGFVPTTQIDWSTVTDEVLYFTDVSKACQQALEAMGARCRSGSSEQVRARMKGLTCRFGKKLEVQLEGGQLILTTFPGAEGAPEKVKEALSR